MLPFWQPLRPFGPPPLTQGRLWLGANSHQLNDHLPQQAPGTFVPGAFSHFTSSIISLKLSAFAYSNSVVFSSG